MMLAAGRPSTRTRFIGSTLSTDGARPNEHIIVAVATTCGCPIVEPPSGFRALDRLVQHRARGRHEADDVAVMALLPPPRRRQQVGEEQRRVLIVDADV